MRSLKAIGLVLLSIAAVTPIVAGFVHANLPPIVWQGVGACIVVSNVVAFLVALKNANADGTGSGAGLMMFLFLALACVGLALFGGVGGENGQPVWGTTTGGLSLFTLACNALFMAPHIKRVWRPVDATKVRCQFV